MSPSTLVPPNWDLPALIRERLGENVGRQRAMYANDHLLLVLHAPPRPEDDERQGRYFWRNPEGEWKSSDLGSGPNALKTHLDQYAAAVERFDVQEERAASAEDYFAVVEGVAPLARAAQHLHQVLQEARERIPHDRVLIDFRDRAYAIERQAELLYAAAKSGLEFAVAKRSEELAQSGHRMATSAHRLNLLAAFFFPVATLAAILGVNLKHGFEESPPPWSFLVFVLGGLVCGVVLTLFVMRNPRGIK